MPERLKALAVIPARYASTRLPGKPLVEIAGKTMTEHVYRRAQQSASLDGVLVATDHEEIFRAVQAFGGDVVMTSPNHPSGTDRIAEAIRERGVDIVVNVQGDEPLLDPREIDLVVEPLRADSSLRMSTLATPIQDPRDVQDPGVVKVVVDRRSRALYFSRLPIPFYRSGSDGPHFKHVGLYAYRKSFLLEYAKLEPTPLERAEALEQMRVLENGHDIYVAFSEHDAVSVDTPEDLERVRALMAG
jgi:3-deoxy-manno-octulosonate cytidylyltransferase (CMP-KDO synthetase)